MSLDAIFRPRAVAVVGASRKRGTIAAEVFHNLVTSGFAGAVYPVNPKAEVVQSVRAYADIEAIPDAVDLAVVVVPAAQVLEAVEACGRKGVRGVIVITAGFAEIGGEGRVRQEALVEVVRRYGMRLVGPNCLGVVNAELDVALNATFAPTFPPFGNVAFSSQSGALGLAILEVARDLGVGISQFVSMGNRADVSGNDLIEYWGEAAGTEVILLYLENLGNPARFMDIARKVSRKKPIVAVKSGRTEAGARAASSHTGSLAGMDVAVDALLGQAGVIRTDTIDELFDVAMLLANQPVPRGRRVGIVTNAGGPGIMATDALASRGLEVVRLRDETQARLAAFLPAEASVKNPIDMIASATAQQYDRALSELVASDEVDAILVLFVTPHRDRGARRGRGDRAGRDPLRQDHPHLLHGASRRAGGGLLAAREGRPLVRVPESAAAALAKAVRYGEWLASPEGVVPTLEGIDAPRARRAVAGAASGRWLSPDEVRELLAAYGISMPRSSVVTSAAEAAEQAGHVGLPMALKLVSDTITHKSDVGGVVLGIASVDEARRAYAELRGRLEALGRGAEMQGALLQQMVPPGVEDLRRRDEGTPTLAT
jgi:acetyl coenzyme A synthetase (ADP forming)-like protein